MMKIDNWVSIASSSLASSIQCFWPTVAHSSTIRCVPERKSANPRRESEKTTDRNRLEPFVMSITRSLTIWNTYNFHLANNNTHRDMKHFSLTLGVDLFWCDFRRRFRWCHNWILFQIYFHFTCNMQWIFPDWAVIWTAVVSSMGKHRQNDKRQPRKKLVFPVLYSQSCRENGRCTTHDTKLENCSVDDDEWCVCVCVFFHFHTFAFHIND